LLGSLILHNEALLAQALADIGVNVLEPTTQLGVLVSITVDVVQRLEEVRQGGVVGKALDESLLESAMHLFLRCINTHTQVLLNSLHAVSGADVLNGTATVGTGLLGVASVLLSHVKQGFNSLLV
jgi:hypothetical protein